MTTTTTTPITTLDKVNAVQIVSTWNNIYELKNEIAVGRTGSSRRGTSGSKIHVLHIERIVKALDESKANRVGSLFSAYGSCNGNGQMNATPIKGATLDMVTCEKCKRNAEYLIAKYSQQ